MNWVGGARTRVKFQGDRRRQKEFFERKKLDLRYEQGQKRRASSHSSKTRKKHLSQDLVALHTVSSSSMKAGNSSRAVNVQYVDLDRHRAGRLMGRLDNNRRPFTMGLRPSRVPTTVNLPFSPDLFPSQLQLSESLTPSPGRTEGKAVHMMASPFIRKADDAPDSSKCSGSDHSFHLVSAPATYKSPSCKNKRELFQNSGEILYTPHSLSQPTVSLWRDGYFDICSSQSNQKGHGVSAMTTMPLQSLTENQLSLVARDSHSFPNRRVMEQFLAQEQTASKLRPLSRSFYRENQTSSHLQTQLHPRPMETLAYEDYKVLQNYECGNRPFPCSQTTPVDQQNVNYDRGSILGRKTTFWERTDQKALISSVTYAARSKKDGTYEAYERPYETFKKMNRLDDMLLSQTMNLSSRNKNVFEGKVSVEKYETERQPSTFESLKHPYVDDHRSRLKNLWVSEDFQTTPPRSDSKVVGRKSPICLSQFHTSRQKPKTSKWESFLDESDQSLTRFGVSQSPSPHFSKKNSQARGDNQRDSRLIKNNFSELTDDVLSDSDSETNNHFRHSQKSMENVKTNHKPPVCGSKTSLLQIGLGEPYLCQPQQTGEKEDTGTVKRLPSNRVHDWSHGLLAQRGFMTHHWATQLDTGTGSEHTVASANSIGLTTAMGNMLRNKPPIPLTPKQWPPKENQAEEVLQELAQLEGLCKDGNTGPNFRRGGSLRGNPEGLLHVESPQVSTTHRNDKETPLKHQANDKRMRRPVANDTAMERHGNTAQLLQSHADVPEQDRHVLDSDTIETLQESSGVSSASHPSCVLDTSVTGCPQYSLVVESYPERQVLEVVDTLVNAVAGVDDSDKPTTAQRTVYGRSLKWQSPLATNTQETDKPATPTPELMQLDSDVRAYSNELVNVSVQTDMSLLAVEIPLDLFSSRTPGLPERAVVDRGVQWESLFSSPKSAAASPQHTDTAASPQSAAPSAVIQTTADNSEIDIVSTDTSRRGSDTPRQ